MTSFPLLSLAIWVPILGGLLVLATGSDRNAGLARVVALVVALLGLAVSAPLFFGFDATQAGMQFVEFKPWVRYFSINYSLGVDGISMPFVVLNSFITVIVVVDTYR